MQRSGGPTMAKRSTKSSVSVPAWRESPRVWALHVVVGAQRLEHARGRPAETGPLALPCITEKRAKVVRPPRTRPRAAVDVGVAAHVDVGAEGDARRDRGRRPCGVFFASAMPQCQALDVGAQGEHHPLGMQRRHGDHLGAAGRDLDRHLGAALGDPGDAAGGRRVVQVQLRHRRRHLVRDVDLVEAHRLAAQVGLQLPQVALELRQPGRRAAEMGERRIAAADAQHGAAVRDAVDAGDRGRRRRGMAGHRVGDAGAEPDPRRDGGRERQRDIGIAREVLRIDHQHAVPAGRLDLLRGARRAARRRDAGGPQLHVLPPPLCRVRFQHSGFRRRRVQCKLP